MLAAQQRGIGQSTAVGIGGDPIIGTTFVDVLDLFEQRRGDAAVVMIGEIGGARKRKRRNSSRSK